MDHLYIYILAVLLLLAIIDLIVGVSNDAVNFLNSAVGSKVTTRKNILIIASLGIFLGASLSSGMMEVARKGIFNPEMFTFADVMIIFLAVMLTDILLLDFFNSFGLPTSTTVSIVFELLGAAVILAAVKSNFDPELINQYINSDSALTIIGGIFLSVGVAFIFGIVIQFMSRILFSYNYENGTKWKAPIWSSVALTILMYFILIKGAKHNIFLSVEIKKWITDHTILLLFSGLGISLFITLILSMIQVNVLKVVVLVGTFSLALSFASNDLVNFIGVPLAGLSSFQSWASSAMPAGEYRMFALQQPILIEGYLLVVAGIIMISALWFSRKARGVTATEVNLASTSTQNERFKANKVSKGVVRAGLKSYEFIKGVTPKKISHAIKKQYTPTVPHPDRNPPAFDLVRASVNLTAASILISMATSFKLPLSTTYISFMVAMGTALADRAWGRKSAAQRISGVFTVLSGWFMTAFIAFSVSAFIAFVIYKLEVVGLVLVALGIIFSLTVSHKLFKGQQTGDSELLQGAA